MIEEESNRLGHLSSFQVESMDDKQSIDDNADESPAVKRAREKCLAQMHEERQHFTPEQLHEVRKRMVGWIDRHASERMPIRETIQLFDANRHRTPRSEAVKTLQTNLVREMARERQLKNVAEEHGLAALRGRVRQQEPRPMPDPAPKTDWEGQ